MPDELEQLFPQARIVEVAGRQVKILPLKIRQLPGVARCLRPVLGVLAQGDADLLAIYCEHAEAVNEAIGVMAGIPKAEVDEMDVGDGLAIFAAVLEVNRAFFTSRLPELVKQAAGSGPTQL